MGDDRWQWQSYNNLPYLTCTLMADWSHGFFTQQWSSHSPEELSKVFNPDADAYRLTQVHGKQVLTPSEISEVKGKDSAYADGDGLVTDSSQQSVWVASADCTPVLIGDRASGRVAAVHAGWRGTAKRIVPCAIARMIDSGSKVKNLCVAMGPAISGEVYQVTEAVAADLGRSVFTNSKLDSTEAIAYLWQQANTPLIADQSPGKVKVDIRQVNCIQLQQLGIDSDQIAIAPYCTYKHPKYFFSYRRNPLKKIQWSGIISN